MADTDAFSDLEIVAKTLDGEAGNQGIQGMTAVANVIRNRAALAWQGETSLRGVCLHPYQFSCWLPGPDRERIMASTNPACIPIAQAALDRTLVDITNGADSYEVHGTQAYWANRLTPVATIGDQDFYITRNIPSEA